MLQIRDIRLEIGKWRRNKPIFVEIAEKVGADVTWLGQLFLIQPKLSAGQ